MNKYIKHPAADYELPTTPFLEECDMTDDEACNEVLGFCLDRWSSFITDWTKDNEKNIKHIVKIMFVDSDPSNEYSDVIVDISDIITRAFIGDCIDALQSTAEQEGE